MKMEITVVVAYALVGCAGWMPHDKVDQRMAWAGEGAPECRGDREPTIEGYITEYACSRYTDGYSYQQYYAAFDEDEFDHVKAAMMIVDCVGGGPCVPDDERSGGFYPPGKFDRVYLGGMHWFAKTVDPARVAAAVDKLALSPRFKQLFLARFAGSRTAILASAERLDPERKRLYVELPEKIWTRRAADRKTLASWLSKSDALIVRVDAARKANKPDAKLRAEAIELREHWVAACQRVRPVDWCVTGPVGRPLTRAIVGLSVLLKDGAMADAEDDLLSGQKSQEFAQQEIFLAQYRAMAEEAERYASYHAKAASGATEAQLAAEFGATAPIHIDADSAWAIRTNDGVNIEELRGYADELDGKAIAIERSGDHAVVRYADDVREWEEGVGCRDTGRIAAIDKYGSVSYETKCNDYVKKSKHTAITATVPAIDVANVKPGQYVRLIRARSDKHGYVTRVFDDREHRNVVQIRHFAFHGAPGITSMSAMR